MLAVNGSAFAQNPLAYTLWADGVLDAQLPKSSLYGFGVGLRAEVSKPLRRSSAHAIFAQAGFTHFFGKEAITADIGLANVGYRYQSRRWFNASVGVGGQYWRERLRLDFPDYAIDETFSNLVPSATLGLGLRIKTRYRVGLENRFLIKPQNGSILLRNNAVLSVGYTF